MVLPASSPYQLNLHRLMFVYFYNLSAVTQNERKQPL